MEEKDSSKVKEAAKPEKRRIEYIDLAKGFCICFVVAFHLAGTLGGVMPLNDYMFLFRMPLYYFLSGCFFKTYEDFPGFIKRKVNKLLIPFVAFYVLTSCILPRLLAKCGINMGYLPTSEFLTGFLHERFPNLPIWFLLALFGVNLVFYLIHILSHRTRYPMAVLIVAPILMVCFCNLYMQNTSYYLVEIMCNLPYFVAGYLVFRKTSIMKPNKLDRYLLLQIVASFALLYVFKNYRIHYCISQYICGLAGIYGILALAKLFGRLPFFSYIGRYSIMLLVTHIVVIVLWKHAFSTVAMPLSVRCIVLFVLTMLSYYAIIPLMRRYMPHITAQKDVIPVGKNTKS